MQILDKGQLEIVDTMGDDISIVQAARVSTGSGSKGLESDRKLINYLMRNRHTSPFEHVEYKFYVKAPIFVARQWVRHRTANWNEVSGRYKEMEMEFYYPDKYRAQDTKNKQGSVDGEIVAADLVTDAVNECISAYESLINRGVSREQARIILPLNLYTEWFWKIDLHNLLHFLSLRCDSYAQWEIQQYAFAIARIVRIQNPLAFEAWLNHCANDYIIDHL